MIDREKKYVDKRERERERERELSKKRSCSYNGFFKNRFVKYVLRRYNNAGIYI